MALDKAKILRYTKIVLPVFAGFFLAGFFIGFLTAREECREILAENLWLKRFVAKNTQILLKDNVYRLLFTCPDIDTSFLYDFGNNTIHEFQGEYGKQSFKTAGEGMLSSQSVELSAGIITSTVLAVHKYAVETMYIKKPTSAKGANLRAIVSAISGYGLGYHIGQPNLNPTSETLIPFLRKAENWKTIKRAAIHTIVMLPYYKTMGKTLGKFPRPALMPDQRHALLESDVFKRFIEFSKKISEIDSEIHNKDFHEAQKIALEIREIAPQLQLESKYYYVERALANPFYAKYDLEEIIDKALQNLPKGF